MPPPNHCFYIVLKQNNAAKIFKMRGGDKKIAYNRVEVLARYDLRYGRLHCRRKMPADRQRHRGKHRPQDLA